MRVTGMLVGHTLDPEYQTRRVVFGGEEECACGSSRRSTRFALSQWPMDA